ncbi:MAG: ABC transporter substrate-binding protein [Rhodobacterales bacterium]|nr:ABC transporter substrate-binding protein [Rhodobacterales bacterium]
MIRGTRQIDRISRRGLITSGVLAGVFAASGVPLQAQSRGGTLRLGLSGASESDGWDPRFLRGLFMRVAGQGAVRDCLTEIAASGELTGELAESWESSPDARIWTLTLRRGLSFHDGSPLTATDVLASLDWHRGALSPAASIVAQIDDMNAPGPGQVQITLAAPNADFPFLLSDPHLVIAPLGRMADGIGTGLYRVETFLPGQSARLTRVTPHYKDGRAGWFDAVEIIALNNPSDRIAALAQGSVDAIDSVAGPYLAALESRRDLRVMQATGNAHLIASLPEPFSQDFASALQPALDRQSLIDTSLAGQGRVAADHPVGLMNPYLSPVAPRVHDPDMAAWLTGRTGLDLTTDLVTRVSAGRLTEDWAFSAAIGPGGAWESTLGQDPSFHALLATARATFDSTTRATLYAEAQEIAATRGAVTVAAHLPWTDAHTASLRHGNALGVTLPLDGGRIAERWWFA